MAKLIHTGTRRDYWKTQPIEAPTRDIQRNDLAEFLLTKEAKNLLKKLDATIGEPQLDRMHRLFFPLVIGYWGKREAGLYISSISRTPHGTREEEIKTDPWLDLCVYLQVLDGKLGLTPDFV